MKIQISSILAVFLFAGLSHAETPFKNLPQLQQKLGFTKYYNQVTKKKIKVAVFDKGFEGYQQELGSTLPATTRYQPGPLQAPADVKTEHGLRMAQIFTGLLTNQLQATQFEPELTLFNVFGYTNFAAAIKEVIAQKYDIVLYSEVWEYGGNFDGTGFFNEAVSQATEAGVIWINAAGNFGQTTFNSHVRALEEGWVELPNKNQALELVCQKNPTGKCQMRIVLSWNDFKNDVNEGTDKDLDLALTDDMLNILETGALKQSLDRNENRPGYSKYPREIIVKEVPAGRRYYLRVKDRSQNFDGFDRLRITLDTDFALMPSATKDETLLNPADAKGVVTVGASDSEKSSSSVKLGKPDILTDSSLVLTEGGKEYRGSSNSAAIVAAGFALLKSINPELSAQQLLAMTRRSPAQWDQSGLNLSALGFSFTGNKCFVETALAQPPAHMKEVVARGGVFVQTTLGIRIMTPFDPINLAPGLKRGSANDLILATPYGFKIYPRNTTARIEPGWVEVFQRPVEAGLCNPPKASKLFSL